ncbi:WD40 repeat domain-containing protein [Pleurocapsa sp. PCC 7319]|uniref:WD40 repeat domain-containing protein n=1 Tax=Pleurocapsa sp. PCC 7319 TaxID=118161 RepID=UPI0003483723|nr:hypothetical protein [Pleurocapsa sp. PCC 7319]
MEIVRAIEFDIEQDTHNQIWNVDTGECIRVLSGHDYKTRAIALTPDKQTLTNGSMDGTIRQWDLATR